MTVDTYSRLFAALRGKVLLNEPMAGHTSLKVGGAADYFAEPADQADLKELLKVVRSISLPYFVIGGGYNVLIGDAGFRGVVISLKRLCNMELSSERHIKVEAGVTNQQLVRFSVAKELTGLEFLNGIPGTVGGALSVNAGAHGQSVLEHLDTLVTLHHGDILEMPAKELDFGYRHLELRPGEIIVAAGFVLEQGKADMIQAKLEANQRHRQDSQKIGYPNAGSFFKNPEGQQAWRLIDKAGMRGYQIGGAQVSEVHTNFLINRGGATAADFVMIANEIKKRVLEQSGVALEEEVRMQGDF